MTLFNKPLGINTSRTRMLLAVGTVSVLTTLLIVKPETLAGIHNPVCAKDQVCDEAKQVSWLTWLANRSSSNQLHFVDLLELLSRNDKQE